MTWERVSLWGVVAWPWLRAAVWVAAGWLVARTAEAAVRGAGARATSEQRVAVPAKAVKFALLGLGCAQALREVGFDLSVLLGAAGVFTVAIGFASQTSASNIVAGLFLWLERPFRPGDAITVGGTTGEVIGMGVLSTELRTFDNLFVRVPNEAIMKGEIVNLTRYPIRRFSTDVVVGWETDPDVVERALVGVAARHPNALVEPPSELLFGGFEPAGVRYTWVVWAATPTWKKTRHALMKDAREELIRAGVRYAAPLQRVDAHWSRPCPPPPSS